MFEKVCVLVGSVLEAVSSKVHAPTWAAVAKLQSKVLVADE